MMTKDGQRERESEFIRLNREFARLLSRSTQISIGNDSKLDQERIMISAMYQNLISIIDYYENNHDIYGLAEVQVGLAKYFDFYRIESLMFRGMRPFDSLVTKIVVLARDIWMSGQSQRPSLPYSVCGKHEDNACVMASLGRRYEGADLIEEGWPPLPVKEAINFDSVPLAKILQPGVQVFRVIDQTSNKYGCWWMLSLPKNRRQWRQEMAVLTIWNADNYYIQLTLDSPLHIWQGAAASQRIPKTNCILQGGGCQIWVASKDVNNILSNPQLNVVPTDF